MLASASSMHYVLVGMPWDIWMKIGMPLIIAGLVLVYFGLIPRQARRASMPGPSMGPASPRRTSG
jgi:hypothetical protein